MGANQSKVQGMYLPAQSGKTGKMNSLMIINKHIEETFGEGDINFILSSNNIVLVEQTKQRVESALQEDFIGDVFTWRSGKKLEKKVSAKEMAYDIIEGNIETVVMCANAPRMKHLLETIQLLESSRLFHKKINIWIDEPDVSITLWSKYDKHIFTFSKVNLVTLVSATFKSIFKRYGRLYVLGFEQTHPEVYRCLRDCIKVEVNIVGSPLDYVKHIVPLYDLSKPGVRAFVPGDTTQESHNEIATYLHEQGFVVVLINGVRKEILIPGKPPIDLKAYISEVELNTTLAKLYLENQWNQVPFAVTGHVCVGRGVTFQCIPTESHQGFLFTDGIIPPIADAATAYQMMARLFGNIGHHPNYTPCKIYSNHAMFTKVGKQESCAIHLAKMIHEDGERGAEVGMEEVKKAMNVTINATKNHRVFDTQEEAIAFIGSTFGCRVNRRQALAPETLLVNGANPTVDALLTRWWGIDSKNNYRLVPVVEGWCVYWI